MTTKNLFALILVLVSFNSFSETPFDKGWVYGIGVSYHSDSAFANPEDKEGINSIHPMVGWRGEEAAGYLFLNTYGDLCLTIGKRWVKDLYQKDDVKFSVDLYLGGVIGYGDKLPNFAGGLSPYGAIGAEIKVKDNLVIVQTTGNILVLTYAKPF